MAPQSGKGGIPLAPIATLGPERDGRTDWRTIGLKDPETASDPLGGIVNLAGLFESIANSA